MPTAELRIELLTDVAIPADSRTIGHPSTQRHIPGRLLLGAAASRLYGKLSDADAWRIFQTRAVRFLDGLPELDGTRSVPTPRSLHGLKGVSGSPVFNLLTSQAMEAARKNGGQPEPWSGAEFVSTDLRTAAKVETETSLRTAVGDLGRAAHGLLYSVEVIRAGAVYRARIVAERQDDLDRVVSALEGHQELGRSRKAELGRVRVTRVDANTEAARIQAGGGALHLLAVSPLALRDGATGMRTFTPTPAMVGLPAGWGYDPHHSFVRTIRYSPFHGKRGLPDVERVAIAPGSVLTFTSKGAADTGSLGTALERGVGDHTNEGFGELRVMDGALVDEKRDAPKVLNLQTAANKATDAPAPKDALFAWASSRATAAEQLRKIAEAARDEARNFARTKVGASQWGVIRGMARSARARGLKTNFFIGELHAHVTTGTAKLEKSWGGRFGSGQTVGEALLEMVEDQGDNAASFAETLAEYVVRTKKTKSKADEGDRA